ncbi:MAG: cadherin repeat domain-containing protein, partial [Isosphaeraceae bacterium]
FSPIPSKQLSEKDTLNFSVVANDTDTWQTLTYSLLSSPPAGVTINPASGQISVPAGLTPGTYNFSVKATDNGVPSQSATTPVSVIVSDAPLTATFVSPDRQSGSGLINSLLATVIDANPQGKASDLSALVSWGDGSTSPATIETQSGSNFAIRANHAYTSEGTFYITVTISSKFGSTAQATGQILVANATPVIQPILDKSTNEGTPLSFAVQATDSDTWQKISYKLGSNAPAGVSIDPGTGIVTITDKTAPGSYAINVLVNDDGTPSKSATTSFNLQINPVNHRPVISFSGTPATSFYRNYAYGLSGKIVDADFAPLASATADFGAGSGPQPITLGSDGSFSVNNTYNTNGNFVVKIRAVDTEGLATEKTLSLTIVNPPVRPVGVVANRSRTGLISSIVITFDGDLNSASARNLANYLLLNPGRDKKLGTRDDLRVALRSAAYDSARRTITLTPRAALNIATGLTFQLQVKGLQDSTQAAIDGDRNLTPGGTVLVNLTRTTVSLG